MTATALLAGTAPRRAAAGEEREGERRAGSGRRKTVTTVIHLRAFGFFAAYLNELADHWREG
ncbi:hypothetical protein [Streptomyces sp. NPDC005322]|uniref:hypothetical protein n=1 Tax=unclassified Streptomyces TaxID=2593676 RepID=UPI0033BD38D0